MPDPGVMKKVLFPRFKRLANALRWPATFAAKWSLTAQPREHANPVPETLWPALCLRFPFLAPLSASEATRLRALCTEFVAGKQINSAGEHHLTDSMIACIAVQACLPVLELGLSAYPVFSEIIVYPGEFLVEREFIDEAGVVHRQREPLAGEAWEDGPVILSWEDVRGGAGLDGEGNVVIHEFVHKLDMSNGVVDGLPRFYRSVHPDLSTGEWSVAFETAWQDFNVRLERLETDFPADLDPESEQANALYASLPLDPYAATDPGEFFSVCAEVFFVDPERLNQAYPKVYDLLRRYFRQDPAARLRSSAPRQS
jgi:Mlc titration factor MtfA (ptsG expression regulator)